MKHKIALVDDHPIFLAGLKSLLEEEGDFQVVCTSQSVKEAMENIPGQEVDLALVDFNMPGKNGLELLRLLRGTSPETMVVMLTVEEDEEVISRAMKDGAKGYILKQDSPESLIKSIRACLNGEILLSERIYMKVIDVLRRNAPPAQEDSLVISRLSPREVEIVRLIVQGKNNPEIARELFISESTVKNHISSILRKLAVKDRVELAILAVREGIR